MPPDALAVLFGMLLAIAVIIGGIISDMRRLFGADETPLNNKGAIRKLRHDTGRGKRIGPLHERILHYHEDHQDTDAQN